MTSYYTKSSGRDIDAMHRAFNKLLELCQAGQGAIAAHTKEQIIKLLGKVVETSGAHNSRKSRKVIVNECTLYFLTKHIDPLGLKSGPVLAAFISPNFLDRLRNDSRITDIVYLPWKQGELERFETNNLGAVSI